MKRFVESLWQCARRCDFPWTLGLALVAMSATAHALWSGSAGLVATRQGLCAGEVWRLVTGPFVHSNFGQLARDVIAFVILGSAYEASFKRWWPVFLAAALILPPAAVLVLQPDLDAYYGLSGAVYALLALVFVHEWRSSQGQPPRWVVTFSLISLVKLVYETATGRLLLPMELGAHVRPVPIAHLVGVAVGVLAALGLSRHGQAAATRAHG